VKRSLFDLTGKIAVVTGAAKGLGRAIAEGYSDYGATVALVDIDVEGIERATEMITAGGGTATAIECDITNEAQVEAAVAQTVNIFGQVDIAANVAGIAGRCAAEEMPYELWDRVIDINLRGCFLFSVAAGRQMIRQGKGGRIINMASVAGLVGLETGNINYAASKGGVIAMSRCLALEWAKHNILVNTVAPTHFRTPILSDVLKQKPDTIDYFLSNIPLGRLGEPDEIVGPFVFLASEASSMVTGHCLVVDGGHTAK
jgi:NAD(P)-dependent dehydrogenase (short-subunit alcohol dehydrogenase family)